MHTIVVDLGFGDAGKGTMVDALCDRTGASLVVRFSGGCQAAHNVVTDDGRHHTFAQFGSGTFQGARTFLSRHMMVEPLSMMLEHDALGDQLLGRDVFVDREALVTTPFHWLVNRFEEFRLGHGSTGRGIGTTARYALEHPDAPIVGDLAYPERIGPKLEALQQWYEGLVDPDWRSTVDLKQLVEQYDQWCRTYRVVDGEWLQDELDAGPVIFEGSQGVLLDEWYGFHPHTTWATTTNANALELLDGREAETIGVVRTFTTRHGAGPLPTEDEGLDITLGTREAHNVGGFAGRFRFGHFDAVLHDYALSVCPVDRLAVTHLDWPALKVCIGYEDAAFLVANRNRDLAYQEKLTKQLFDAKPLYHRFGFDVGDEIADMLGVPLAATSHGPKTGDKVWRGN